MAATASCPLARTYHDQERRIATPKRWKAKRSEKGETRINQSSNTIKSNNYQVCKKTWAKFTSFGPSSLLKERVRTTITWIIATIRTEETCLIISCTKWAHCPIRLCSPGATRPSSNGWLQDNCHLQKSAWVSFVKNHLCLWLQNTVRESRFQSLRRYMSVHRFPQWKQILEISQNNL